MWGCFYELNLILFTEPVEINRMEIEDEEEEEEVAYQEGKMENEPQIDQKEAEGGIEDGGLDVAGPSCPAGTSHPPDEEQAGFLTIF